MEEPLGQQYALQVAVQTMKERCLQLQQRLSLVEEENMKLRLKCVNLDKQEISESNVESLKAKIAQLTKQKAQLAHNILMVATENRNLWSHLSKLTHVKDAEPDKVTDLVKNSPDDPPTPHSALIRSKTFTQETPPPKLVPKTGEHNFSDSSLEDISLRLITNIANEKIELEKQCAQMDELHSNESFMSNSIGFAYPQDELDDLDVSQIVQNMDSLKAIKQMLVAQQDKLKMNFETLKIIQSSGVLCNNCKEQRNKIETDSKENNISVNKLSKGESSVRYSDGSSDEEVETVEKMCPMCSVVFSVNMCDFVLHVQGHFTGERDDFVIVNSENAF